MAATRLHLPLEAAALPVGGVLVPVDGEVAVGDGNHLLLLPGPTRRHLAEDEEVADHSLDSHGLDASCRCAVGRDARPPCALVFLLVATEQGFVELALQRLLFLVRPHKDVRGRRCVHRRLRLLFHVEAGRCGQRDARTAEEGKKLGNAAEHADLSCAPEAPGRQMNLEEWPAGRDPAALLCVPLTQAPEVARRGSRKYVRSLITHDEPIDMETQSAQVRDNSRSLGKAKAHDVAVLLIGLRNVFCCHIQRTTTLEPAQDHQQEVVLCYEL
mmetsp:Transcript_4585/g.10605  ORF Transcript_4585/g.10605 Transcript_4585/m.10605 type:complete len:271 (+) Transcript_4585:356-1168(+)